MDTHDVEAVVAVIDYGSFAKAAIVLQLTPEGVSRRVRSLEKDLGVVLLDREGRRPVLTAAALQRVPLFRNMLSLASALKKAA